MTVGFYLFILPYKKGEREFKAMFNPWKEMDIVNVADKPKY